MTPTLEILEGGKVLGIGCDLAEVERIRDTHKRNGQGFLDRVFTKAEQEYCLKQSNPYPSFAARWAAKEAVSKAFTTGIGADVGLLTVEIGHGANGNPVAILHGKTQELLARFGGKEVKISLSHTRELAMAMAAIVG